ARARLIAARDFFRDALVTALEPGEILTEVAVTVAPAGSRVAFREHARRRGDFATVSAAAQLSPDHGVLQVRLGAVGPVPVICKQIQDAFVRRDLLAELDNLIAAEVAEVDAISDVHTSATYRRKLAAICLGDCIRELIA